MYKTCEYCGQEFIPNRSDQKYCSYECGEKNRAKRKKEKPPTHLGGKRKCIICGDEFEPRVNNQIKCDKCRRKNIYTCMACGKNYIAQNSNYRICPECKEEKKKSAIGGVRINLMPYKAYERANSLTAKQKKKKRWTLDDACAEMRERGFIKPNGLYDYQAYQIWQAAGRPGR